jgi:dihydrolipoamide dehydrogenase
LPGLEADGERVWTYKHALVPPHMPKKLLVIGSGAIGIEFASFYNTLGADTTVVEVMDRILPVEDEEISLREESFEKQGMKIMSKAMVKKLDRAADKVTAHIEAGGKTERWSSTPSSPPWASWQYRGTSAWSAGREVDRTHVVTDPTAAPGSRGSMPSATSPARRGWRTRRATKASWWPN